MSSSGFLPKNRPLICKPDRSANQMPDFFLRETTCPPDFSSHFIVFDVFEAELKNNIV